MASTYNSNYFSIEKMTTGEKDGTWGDITNNNWITIQQVIGATSVISTEDVTGSSTYNKVTPTPPAPVYGVLELLLPDATSYSALSIK